MLRTFCCRLVLGNIKSWKQLAELLWIVLKMLGEEKPIIMKRDLYTDRMFPASNTSVFFYYCTPPAQFRGQISWLTPKVSFKLYKTVILAELNFKVSKWQLALKDCLWVFLLFRNTEVIKPMYVSANNICVVVFKSGCLFVGLI